jgi:hypothetical protein
VPALALLGERRRRESFGRDGQVAPAQDLVERLDQRLDRDVALRGIARCHCVEQLPEPVAAQPRRDLHRPAAREQPRRRARLREGVPSRQALEKDQPPGVEVRARRRPLAGQLLGRRIQRRAQELARLGQRLPLLPAPSLGEPAQAEVEHDGVAPGRRATQHDVGGLEVPVDDALRVGAGQRLEHLGQEPHGLANAELPVARERLLQRLAGDVGENGVELPFRRLARVDQAHDVRVGEIGANPRLAAEALDLAAGGFLRPLARSEELDRDGLSRGELARLVDAAEASRPQLREDLVAFLEAGSDSQRRHRRLQGRHLSPREAKSRSIIVLRRHSEREVRIRPDPGTGILMMLVLTCDIGAFELL